MLRIERDFDVATQSVRGEHEVDGSAKLVRDEIANEVGAVASLTWSLCGWDPQSAPAAHAFFSLAFKGHRPLLLGDPDGRVEQCQGLTPLAVGRTS
jgi:hypothetical protein